MLVTMGIPSDCLEKQDISCSKKYGHRMHFTFYVFHNYKIVFTAPKKSCYCENENHKMRVSHQNGLSCTHTSSSELLMKEGENKSSHFDWTLSVACFSCAFGTGFVFSRCKIYSDLFDLMTIPEDVLWRLSRTIWS